MAGPVTSAQPSPDMTRVREVFRAAKAESGMTYDQLAGATGLARQTLVNIAQGRYRGDLRTWLLLARAWDRSLDELLAQLWHD